MVKDILGFAGQRDLINQLATDQIVQDRINAQRLQQVPAELRADDRRSTQGALGRRVEAVDAGGNGRLHSGGHADLGSADRRNVATALPVQHTALGQFAHDLLGEKRVTGGPLAAAHLKVTSPAHRK